MELMNTTHSRVKMDKMSTYSKFMYLQTAQLPLFHHACCLLLTLFDLPSVLLMHVTFTINIFTEFTYCTIIYMPIR